MYHLIQLIEMGGKLVSWKKVPGDQNPQIFSWVQLCSVTSVDGVT